MGLVGALTEVEGLMVEDTEGWLLDFGCEGARFEFETRGFLLLDANVASVKEQQSRVNTQHLVLSSSPLSFFHI